MRQVTVSAPGKCIITGEHSVVYGLPALAVALDIRAKVTAKHYEKGKILIQAKQFNKNLVLPIKIDDRISVEKEIYPIYISVIKTLGYLQVSDGVELVINSDIPDAAGLGSSAAVSVCTVKSIGELFSADLKKQEISNLAFESEKVVHGAPSGIDNAISVYGGGLLYRRGRISKLNLPGDIPLIIGDTLKKRNTGALVKKVRENYLEYPKIFKPIMNAIGRISIQARQSLEKNDLPKLGELMNINQGLLESMGVSTIELEKLIHAARESQAYGAKLTGAGGGGCIVALSNQNNRQNIAEKINEAGGKAYITRISAEGVRVDG